MNRFFILLSWREDTNYDKLREISNICYCQSYEMISHKPPMTNRDVYAEQAELKFFLSSM